MLAILGVCISLLLLFGLAQVLGIAVGSLSDWLIAIAIIGWLATIVTIPWDIYFKAKDVIATAAHSQDVGIGVDAAQIRYVKLLAQRALWVALALHSLSALVLYSLAITQLGLVGYLGAIASVLLTVVRPAIAFYRFLADRLAAIHTQVTYPRQDVVELRRRVETLETSLTTIQASLDTTDPLSWAAKQSQAWEATRQDLATIQATQRQLAATQAQDTERLARQTEQAISQLSADGRFLSQVRELIRFVKES